MEGSKETAGAGVKEKGREKVMPNEMTLSRAILTAF